METKKTTQKTTITFPANLLMGLRAYMAREGKGLHDQSKVVAEALREYLEARGISIENDEKNFRFEVVQIDD